MINKFTKTILTMSVFTLMGVSAVSINALGYGSSIVIPATTYSVNGSFSGGCSSFSSFTNLDYAQQPGQSAPFEAVDFSLSCLPGASTTITLSFNGFQGPGTLFKLNPGNFLEVIPGITGNFAGNTNTFTYVVVDNGPLDTNPALGVIDDPVVFISANAAPASGGGGGGGGGGGFYSYLTNIFDTVPAVNLTTGNTVGRVLGASTTAANCANFITKFGTVGSRGADVTKLQQFLIKYEGATFNATGYYGPMTRNAVRAFQAKNGINPTSGLQYSKTTKAINDKYCGYVAQGKGL